MHIDRTIRQIANANSVFDLFAGSALQLLGDVADGAPPSLQCVDRQLVSRARRTLKRLCGKALGLHAVEQLHAYALFGQEMLLTRTEGQHLAMRLRAQVDRTVACCRQALESGSRDTTAIWQLVQLCHPVGALLSTALTLQELRPFHAARALLQMYLEAVPGQEHVESLHLEGVLGFLDMRVLCPQWVEEMLQQFDVSEGAAPLSLSASGVRPGVWFAGGLHGYGQGDWRARSATMQ